MIRCNLAVLLAEKGIRIAKVSKDTGISRTTLTALSYNQNQGIQFDTLNELCLYLKITPKELLSYIPKDVQILKFTMHELTLKITLGIRNEGSPAKKDVNKARLTGIVEEHENETFSITITPEDFVDEVIESNNEDERLMYMEMDDTNEKVLCKFFGCMPRPFFYDFEARIIEEFITLTKQELDLVLSFEDVSVYWKGDCFNT